MNKIFIIIITMLCSYAGEESDFDPDLVKGLYDSGVFLNADELKWVETSKLPPMTLSKVAQDYLEILNLAKKKFIEDYKDREIVYSKVNISISDADLNNVRVVQVVVFFHFKNMKNFGTPLCVGYLIRSDKDLIEQPAQIADKEKPDGDGQNTTTQ